ncbi:MAG: TetR/AcrR family transcriptional regulator [Actinomycetia bacterium]|nr:TetR/AcrR family transcriptional regulator [Actinomycetes bacterium]
MTATSNSATPDAEPAGERKSTRDRILEAAMDLFAEDGFSGTTISEVERRVGLAAGTGSLYRHFPSKEALLRAAVEREVADVRAEIRSHADAAAESAGPDDPAERRLRDYRERLHDMRRCDRLFRLMLNEGDRVAELREAVWDALRVPVKGNPDTGDVITAVAEAAIGGYHLFSLMQGRPYNGVAEDTFLRELVQVTMAGHGIAPA